VRGYWIVRYLEGVHPGFVRSMPAARLSLAAIEHRISERLGLQPQSLWEKIDDKVEGHFHHRDLTTP
jgi:hypothetical protein